MDSFGRKHAIFVIPITVTLVSVHVPVLVIRVPVDVDHEALSYLWHSVSLLLETFSKLYFIRDFKAH